MSPVAPLLLSLDELSEITGYKLARHQIAWLRQKGWRFEVNGSRRPIVARKYAEKMLGCSASDEQAYKPNFRALQGT